MNKFTRLMAIMLVAVMAVSCFAFNASAADKTVTVNVGDVEVAYNADKLALLADGNTASDATAYNNEGLVSFENKGFTHTDGVDAAVEATFEIVRDLGEVQAIGSISLDAYKESASMIALPTVNYYVSVDGENYYHINAGNAVPPAEDAAESTVATIKADFSSRIAVNARYVKAVVTFKNGWVFLSELSVGAAAEGVEAENPDKAHAYTENATTVPGIGVFDSTYTGANEDGTAGVIDCSLNTDGNNFLNSQLIKAAYDADADAYKIIYSKVNPWNKDETLNGHRFTETLAEGEILVSIVTGGTTADGFSGSKWIARGLTAGDWVVLKNSTVTFLPASAIVIEDTPVVPSVPTTPVVPAEYESSYKDLVGADAANAAFDLVLESETDEDGIVTVTLTVDNIADDVASQLLMAALYFDTDKLELITEKDEDGAYDCITDAPSNKWESVCHIDEETGALMIEVCNATLGDDGVIAKDTNYFELTFTFQLKEGCTYGGMYIPTDSVEMANFDTEVDYYGNGAYEIAVAPGVKVPTTGDAGVIVFAVLGVIAICGVAVVIKVRH